jgi:hypothetical protein
MTTSGQRAFRLVWRTSRSAWRRISCARRFRAWNAANAPPAGAVRSAIVDIDPIAETSVCVPAATAPIIAEPSSTGSAVSGASTVLPQTSAMIWRTNGLCAAPPLTTIASNS